jgi:hypothetical protein
MKKAITITHVPGLGCQAIVIDNEVFDWGMDGESLRAAILMSKNDPEMKKTLMGDIQRSFVTAFSEFVGKPVTLSDINLALKEGYI